MIRKFRKWRESRATYDLSFIASDISSIDADLFFRMDFQVSWTDFGVVQHHYSPEAVIRSFVRDRVQRICRHESIANFQSVEDKINSALGKSRLLAQGSVRILGGCGRMDISPEVVGDAHTRKLKRLEAMAMDREQEEVFRRVASFRRRILEDPGMALTYWFMENPDKLGGQSIGEIEGLVDRLAERDSDSAWVLIAKIIQEFVDGLSLEERKDSIEVLILFFQRYGRYDMVERLRSDLGG